MCNMYHDCFLSSFQTPSHQMGREKTPKLQKNKGSCKGKMRNGTKMVANPTSGSWEIECVSSAIGSHSPDQICFCQIAEMGINKPKSFGMAASILQVLVNLRI